MDPKLENLSITSSTDEKADGFNFWVDTRETSDEKAIQGTFLTAFGKEAFPLLKTLVYYTTLIDASVAEIQEALLQHARPAQLELSNGQSFTHWSEILMKLCVISLLGCNTNLRSLNSRVS